MTVTAWRIVTPRYRKPLVAFNGEGARKTGGRWNSKGVAVTYTSESPSLAILELRVHILPDPDLLYYLIPVSFDRRLMSSLLPDDLPADWKSYPTPPELRAMGDRWAQSRTSAVLRVPSVLVEIQWNYLINPKHPSYPSSFRFGNPIKFRFDPRLV